MLQADDAGAVADRARQLVVERVLEAEHGAAGDYRQGRWQAVRDDNPVLVFEHKRLYSVKGELNDDPVELGGARVVRRGGDVTIVSAMTGVPVALAAAELAAAGIDAEVVDVRVLRPFDFRTPAESPARTNRLVVLEKGAAPAAGRLPPWLRKQRLGAAVGA